VNPAWIAAICALTTIIFAVIGWVGRGSWRFLRKVWRFLEDWNGTPADSHGHEGRSGVMERLVLLEQGLADVQAQVHLNSGHSMKDAVARTEAAVSNNTAQLTALKLVVDKLQAR
jgi:hypothetical protein